MSVNKVILVGRLGQNPELRKTGSGSAVTSLRVATNEVYQDRNGQKQEKTEWHSVVVWGKAAESCSQFLSKGRQVYLEGRLQTRQWQDKEGQNRYTTEIVANNVQFLGGGESSAKNGNESDFGGRPFSSSDFQNTASSVSQSFSAPSSPSPSFSPGSAFGAGQEEAPFTEDDIPF